MVVVWNDPCPGSGYLSSVARSGECQRWSNVEGWWPDNWESELSVVAINVYCPRWLSQIWGFLVASPTPRGTSPLGRAAVPAFVTSQHAEKCVYKCPPAWKQCGLWPRYILYGGTSLAFSTSGAHQSQSDLCNINIQESTYIRLAWNEPLLTRVVWNIRKISFFLA